MSLRRASPSVRGNDCVITRFPAAIATLSVDGSTPQCAVMPSRTISFRCGSGTNISCCNRADVTHGIIAFQPDHRPLPELPSEHHRLGGHLRPGQPARPVLVTHVAVEA